MPDGSRRWMQARGIAARNSSGQAIRVAGSQTDITEFRHAQAELAEHRHHLEQLVAQRTTELREADDRLRSAFNAATEAFAVFDRQGRRLLANAGFDTLFPGAAAVGTNALQAVAMAALGNAAPAEALVAEITNPSGIEKEIHLPGGTWIRITTRMTANGDIVFCAADVSVYKNAAVAAETALERQKELNRLQRGFVSMVSHQFRTPLSIIDVAAQRLVSRGELAAQAGVDERVSKIRRAVERMTGLIESTLSLASLDAGTLAFRPSSCNLAALIAEVAERQTDVSPSHAIAVDTVWLPERVRCDANLVEQVIVNLLSNAVKYSPENSRVEIRGWTEGSIAAIAIRDYGVGIEDADLPYVFDRFFRGKTALGIPGTGIGLSVVQHLVSLHNGSVSVTSKLSQGSTFTVRLPITGADAGPVSAAAS
jgi:signal transduction histidine kinase